MKTFKIEGGHQLKGEIQPQGAKNEALQILCAVLLTPEKVTINNIPDIVDVNKLITLLDNLGVKVNKLGKGSYSFQADDIDLDYLESDAFKIEGRGLRGSIMIDLGANLDYVDIEGRNTADMAKKGGFQDAIALAEELGLTPTSTE